MSKKYHLLLICIVSIFSAHPKNFFQDEFQKYFKGYSYNPSDNELSIIKTVVGDTIFIDTEENCIYNLIQTTPDTLWLKKKRAKKPKEGKHYKLIYNYKGQANESGTYYTPTDSIRNKPFGLMSVKPIYNSSYTYSPDGYKLTLLDFTTTQLLYWTIDKGLNGNLQLRSANVSQRLNALVDSTFYFASSSYRSTAKEAWKLFEAKFFINIKKRSSILPEITSQFDLSFTDENGQYQHRTYDNNAFRYHSYNTDIFITSAEREKEIKEELERTRVYEIETYMPSSARLDSITKKYNFNIIAGAVSSYSSYISQTIKPQSPLGYTTHIPHGEVILIGDKITVRGEDYFKAIADDKAFYIECNDVALLDEEQRRLDSLLTTSQAYRDAFFDFSKYIGVKYYQNKRDEIRQKLFAYAKNGIMILEARPYDMSEYTDGTGMRFEIVNTTSKTIKYITFNFTGYNAVDDPVTSYGKSKLSSKGIGPIAPNESAAYDFEYVWFTDIIEIAKLRSIVCQYTDGTTRTFSGKAIEIIPEEITEVASAPERFTNLKPIVE